MSRTIQFVATGPEPGANYTPAYRHFFERLRRARIDKGLSLSDMSDEVGLTFKLAYEFETLVTPLPFEWLEIWCKVVGVPFDDYLAVYWASEEAYSEAKERESQTKEARERGDALTKIEADTTETAAPAPSNAGLNRGFGLLSSLRAAVDRVVSFFRSFFSAP